MIIQGLKYPFTLQDNRLWRKMLIGSGLLVTSPLILPLIIYLGYFYRLVESIIDNSDTLPDFTKFSELIKDGTKFTGLLLLYTILLLGTIWISFSLDGLLQIVISVLAGIFYIVILHLTPLMIYRYVRTDSIKSVFNFSKLFQDSMTRKYTYITVLMSFIYPILFGIIQGVTILTLVGVIFIPIIGFWQTISQAYLLAQLKQIE